jgi:N-acetyl-gamma-glutamyl-phosphate reductase
MIKTAIVGASGYTGIELIKILLNHPYFEIKGLFGSCLLYTSPSPRD